VPSEPKVPQKHLDQLETYRQCIKAAQRFMDEKGYHRKWRRYIDVYSKNTRCPDGEEKNNVANVHVPIAFSNVNIQRAALTVNHPRFTINPRNVESLQAAAIAEECLNYEWLHHDYQVQVRKALDDFLIPGNMWGKTGYLSAKWGPPQDRLDATSINRSLGDNQSESAFIELFRNEGFDSEFDKLIEENRQVLWQSHGSGDALPTRSRIARELRANGSVIIHDRTMFERVSPFDMLVDPKATCLENAQWVAQRVPVRLDIAKKNTDWPKHVRDALGAKEKSLAKGDDNSATYTPTLDSTSQDEYHQWVIMWELYDLHEGTWCHFADEGKDFLRRPEASPFRFGHPFVYRGNYSIPDEFYHMGEIEMIESLQNELNDTRSDLANARRQIKRKYIVDKELWDARSSTGKSLPEVINSPEDNLVAVVDFPNQASIKDKICLLPQHDIDPNLYNTFAAVMNDMNQVTGITDFQRGAGSAGASTATEAAILNDGALARLQEKQGKIEMFMRDAARNLIMLKQEYMTRDHVLRITDGGVTQAAKQFRDRMDESGVAINPALTGLFLAYGRNDIAGEFDFEVEAGSTTAYNETQRRRQYQELLQTLAPFAQAGMVDIRALLVEVVQNGFRIPNAGRFIIQPQQQQSGPVNPVTGQPGGGIPGISTQAGIQAQGGGIPASASGVPPELSALVQQVIGDQSLTTIA